MVATGCGICHLVDCRVHLNARIILGDLHELIT